MSDPTQIADRALSLLEGAHRVPDYRGAAAALFSGLAVPAGAACYLAHDGHPQLSAAFFCLSCAMGMFLTWTILPRQK